MRLYILRHTEAADTYPDAERALTQKGRDTASRLGTYLKGRGIGPIHRIVHSPYKRAHETAAICADAMGSSAPLESMATFTPEDEVDSAVALVSSAQESLLLVGHNPHLTFLTARLLTTRESGMGISLSKGGLVCLEPVPSLASRKSGHEFWVLRWFLTPKLYGND